MFHIPFSAAKRRRAELLKNQGGSTTTSQVSADEEGRLKVEVLPGGACIEPLSGSESSFISGMCSEFWAAFFSSSNNMFDPHSLRTPCPPAARHQDRSREPERWWDWCQWLSHRRGESVSDLLCLTHISWCNKNLYIEKGHWNITYNMFTNMTTVETQQLKCGIQEGLFVCFFIVTGHEQQQLPGEDKLHPSSICWERCWGEIHTWVKVQVLGFSVHWTQSRRC